MKRIQIQLRCASYWLWLLLASWSLSSTAEPLANRQVAMAPALEALLQQQVEPDERVQLQSLVSAELDPGFAGSERVAIWTRLGPSYWSNQLSVLSQHDGNWRLLATLPLDGMIAELDAVTADGAIHVQAKIPGPNDPICCPTKQQSHTYHYGRGQLVVDQQRFLEHKP